MIDHKFYYRLFLNDESHGKVEFEDLRAAVTRLKVKGTKDEVIDAFSKAYKVQVIKPANHLIFSNEADLTWFLMCIK